MKPSHEIFFEKQSLSLQIYITSCILEEVLRGCSPNLLISSLENDSRSAVQSLTFHSIRNLGWASAIGKKILKSYPNGLFQALFLSSLVLLRFSSIKLDESTKKIPRYKEFTVVNESVKVADKIPFLKPYKSLLNACLRNFLRSKEEILLLAQEDPQAIWNYQEWWINKVRNSYPEKWQQILSCANKESKLSIRVNRKNAIRDYLSKLFDYSGIKNCMFGTDGIILNDSHVVRELPGFNEGWWSVQDSGAQLAVPLLGLRDGMKVLDACAAPGGKTSHILEIANTNLTILDSSRDRLNTLEENLERLKLHSNKLRILEGSAIQLDSWWNGIMFDAILADVPCTASGIVRKHPDIRWTKRIVDIEKSRLIQYNILESLWKTLAPGGRLLYVTCSIFPEECILQVLAFLDKHKDAIILDSPGQLLPSLAEADITVDHDGFFFALFAKKYF